MKADATPQFCKQRLNLFCVVAVHVRTPAYSKDLAPLSGGFIHVGGKEPKRPSGTLRLQRAWTTLGTCPDVRKRPVPVIATTVVQLLACRTGIAVAFRSVREALRAEERTPCSGHGIPRGHIWRTLPVHQPLQQLSIAIAGIGGDGLQIPTLPLGEAGEHLFGQLAIPRSGGRPSPARRRCRHYGYPPDSSCNSPCLLVRILRPQPDPSRSTGIQTQKASSRACTR